MSGPKIYTRLGDDGDTGLYGAGRVAKDDQRVVAYGSVDELSAFLGWAVAGGCGADLDAKLQRVQNILFNIGADLATPHDTPFRERLTGLVAAEDVSTLEAWIDECTAQTPELRAFVLPGGTEAASRLHIGRVMCRRAEREVVTLARAAEIRGEIVMYLNRLSDFLFAAARFANAQARVEDVAWKQSER